MKVVSGTRDGQQTWYLMTDHGYYRQSTLAGLGAEHYRGLSIEAAIAEGDAFLEQLALFEEKVVRSGVEPDPEPSVILAPVPKPGKIICVGLNYRPHVQESQMEVPTTPVLFPKYDNAVIGTGATIRPPLEGRQLDYEAELVVVIGKQARRVPESRALDHVFGYMNGNDLSDRALQFRTSQWMVGKSADGFAPMGPYLVTRDQVPDPTDLEIRCERNGIVVQHGNTKEMIFDVAFLVHYISQYITLNPGDVIFTGTPEGVILGYPEDQRRWLEAGETVRVSITGLGDLETTIGSAE